MRLLTASGIAIFAALALSSHVLADEQMIVPFVEKFASNSLEKGWQIHLSEGNSLKVVDNWLRIEADEGSKAHVLKPLGADYVTVSAKVVWCASVYLVWDADTWCGVGLISPTPFGRFYTTVTAKGSTSETPHSGCDIGSAKYVRVQLGRDCVRFLASEDGNQWKTVRCVERTPEFTGPPSYIAMGKHYGPGMKPFSESDSFNAPGEYSGRYHAAVIELSVDQTPEADMRMTASERKAMDQAGIDRVGSLLLAGKEDPTYKAVSKFYPPMKLPREIVGVPEHPLDIGVDYYGRYDVSPWTPPVAWLEIGDPPVPFGDDGTKITRRLLNGYLPVLTLKTERDGVHYEQTVLGWSEGFSPESDLYAYVRFRVTAKDGARLPKTLALAAQDGKRINWNLEAVGKGAQICFRMKYPEPATAESVTSDEFNKKSREVVSFWKKHLKPVERLEIPDKRVNEAYRAWFVYSMLNADRINGYCEIHDGAGFYDIIFGYSMSLHAMAMDLYGLHDYAERLLDTQLHFQQPDGLYLQECGLPDHGSLLLALATHYHVTKNGEWLKRIAPQMAKLCDWITRQREQAPTEGVTRGLIKFRPYNDYPHPVFNYMGNTYCCQGLAAAAEAFQAAGMSKEAGRYAREATNYRRDILKSMEKAAFRDGDTTLLPIEPDTHRLLKLSFGRGSDYYGLTASCILEHDFLPADDKRAYWITDLMEKRNGLIAGVCEFMEGIDHAYTYGYLMTQMKRDDVRKVILGFWSMFAFGMTRDTYSPVEVSSIATGKNHLTLPHTYSCTQQLRLLRNMLIREDGDTLFIGQAVPREWLQPGKRLEIKEAPTLFGAVSCRITANADGTMRVQLTPPARQAPSKIFVRLREPHGRTIITARGAGIREMEFSGDTLVFRNLTDPVDVVVVFKGD